MRGYVYVCACVCVANINFANYIPSYYDSNIDVARKSRHFRHARARGLIETVKIFPLGFRYQFIRKCHELLRDATSRGHNIEDSIVQ
jgi:hypothetical protein